MSNTLCTVTTVVLLVSMVASPIQAGTLTEVTQFGSNPGNLRMFEYVPDNLPAGRPLVVALHGCVQGAADYDDETGWTKYADEFKFALLLPEQKRWNHWNRCFNWYKAGDISRDQGEALSIRQMIDKMRRDHKTHPRQTYVSGLSAGGAMAYARDQVAKRGRKYCRATVSMCGRPVGGLVYVHETRQRPPTIGLGGAGSCGDESRGSVAESVHLAGRGGYHCGSDECGGAGGPVDRGARY